MENQDKLPKTKLKSHYWITSDSDIKKRLESVPQELQESLATEYFHEYSEINIKPVIYCGDHIFVEELCETLANVKENRNAVVAGLTYSPA